MESQPVWRRGDTDPTSRLVIIVGLTLHDFHGLGQGTDIDVAPLRATSIVLDILRVYTVVGHDYRRR